MSRNMSKNKYTYLRKHWYFFVLFDTCKIRHSNAKCIAYYMEGILLYSLQGCTLFRFYLISNLSKMEYDWM